MSDLSAPENVIDESAMSDGREVGDTDVLSKIAAKRAAAQAARRDARGKLHVAEPALALMVGVTVFLGLAPTQVLMPLWGVTDGVWTMALPIWLLLVTGLFATLTISALRLAVWRRGAQAPARHLGRRFLGLLFLATITICLLVVGAGVLAPR